MRSSLLALVLLVACAHEPDPKLMITHLVVRDAVMKFQAVRIIDDPDTLARITELWVARRALEEESALPVREFHYALDISVKQEKARWLYREDGLAMLLSPEPDVTFEVPDPSAFNALLGISDTADPQVRAE
jgi:hypothetical protein